MKYEIDGETLLYREYFLYLTLALMYQDDEWTDKILFDIKISTFWH